MFRLRRYSSVFLLGRKKGVKRVSTEVLSTVYDAIGRPVCVLHATVLPAIYLWQGLLFLSSRTVKRCRALHG